jgi:hypothetical protein
MTKLNKPMECPCCGNIIRTPPHSLGLLYGDYKGQEYKLLRMLVKSYPKQVYFEDIIGELWPNPNVMPETAISMLRVYIHTLRRKVEPLGWYINKSNRVYWLSTYKRVYRRRK